ncbi:LamB/YcsF family protein [Amycolatopsis sp. FDAARGOS 1241]|nr:LamB/YcsF family protein [Amycolatopsis sp. FDAARGOS 1241]
MHVPNRRGRRLRPGRGGRLTHAKPHGALYGMAAVEPALAAAVARATAEFDPQLTVFLLREELRSPIEEHGVRLVVEGFPELDYDDGAASSPASPKPAPARPAVPLSRISPSGAGWGRPNWTARAKRPRRWSPAASAAAQLHREVPLNDSSLPIAAARGWSHS